MSKHSAENGDNFTQRRAEMVHDQLRARGITDETVLAAMATVPRELFVLPQYTEWAYEDGPVPTLARQTVSQPYIIALMFALLKLKPTDRVLEVGTGSGYAAAVLSRIVSVVYTIERHKKLVEYAREKLQAGGFDTVVVKHGDGTLGWPECAPFDAIVVAAGGPSVPPQLKQQLVVGGRLVLPVGPDQRRQRLVVVERLSEDEFRVLERTAVAFVPLIGEEGWPG